jgi:serine/threonine-protein kinase
MVVGNMQSGQVIVGKYRLNQLLGTGGMAEVWSATNVFTEREFAIKFMTPEVAKTPEHAARFMKEAKVSARVNHPNIIEIIDVGQAEDGQLFLVMELLSGVPLEVAMRRQTPPMTIPELVFVMTEVASALAAAHRSGVIHRDLKPSNIYLHRDKSNAAVPKLLDFGVSKFLEDGGPNMALTMAGTVLGSPLYMSPEQARGDGNIDGRTDIFAFGAILFEALTGQRPYDAANFNALIVKIATTSPKDIDDHGPDVPQALRDVVKLCLETNRDKRPSTFETVADQLMAILPELEKDPKPLPPPKTILSTDDPDATNALPIVRPGDRPLSVPPPAGTNGAPHFSAWPTPTPNLSYTTAPTSLPPPRPQRTAPAIYAVGAAAAAVILGLVIVLVAVLRREPTIITIPGEPRAVATAPQAPTTSTSADVPVVNVDTLPVAPPSAGRPVVPLEKGRGRLVVFATPGWCTLTVDGVSKGPTPVPALDLTPGPHHLKCEAPGKKAKAVSVIIQEAATANYKFTLD